MSPRAVDLLSTELKRLHALLKDNRSEKECEWIFEKIADLHKILFDNVREELAFWEVDTTRLLEAQDRWDAEKAELLRRIAELEAQLGRSA